MSRGGGTSSGALYERGLRVIPGGGNSPVRALGSYHSWACPRCGRVRSRGSS